MSIALLDCATSTITLGDRQFPVYALRLPRAEGDTAPDRELILGAVFDDLLLFIPASESVCVEVSGFGGAVTEANVCTTVCTPVEEPDGEVVYLPGDLRWEDGELHYRDGVPGWNLAEFPLPSDLVTLLDDLADAPLPLSVPDGSRAEFVPLWMLMRDLYGDGA